MSRRRRHRSGREDHFYREYREDHAPASPPAQIAKVDTQSPTFWKYVWGV